MLNYSWCTMGTLQRMRVQTYELYVQEVMKPGVVNRARSKERLAAIEKEIRMREENAKRQRMPYQVPTNQNNV